MAQRYISAMEFTNWHADAVLKKHSKKRPLGDIESKHRYVQIQPVLSSKSVDIDIDGTRTFRPKSSSAVLDEQCETIHKLYDPKHRNIVSAPIRNRTKPPTKNNTTMPQKSSSKRFRHPSSSDKSLVDSSSDISKSSRSCRELTNLIHHQWCPENHSLNEGRYVRGAKHNQDPTAVNTWVTFGGGSNSGDSDRIVNVFTNTRNNREYYSIPGDVGTRLVHQISGGGGIRIGNNGGTQTKESDVKKYVIESKAHMITAENVPVFLEEKTTIVPLSWDNQLGQSDVKVMSPRKRQEKAKAPNLCETHPVVYEKMKEPNIAQVTPFRSFDEGYRIKQTPENRFKSRTKNQKKGITPKRTTEKGDDDFIGVSLDNFLNETFAGKTKPKNSSSAWPERYHESPVRTTVSRDSTITSSQIFDIYPSDASPESQRSNTINVSARRIRPSHPADINRTSGALSLMLTPTSNESLYRNVPKHSSPKPKHKQTLKKAPSAKRSQSAASIKSIRSQPGDTEFIQITQQIKGPTKSISTSSNTTTVKPDSAKRVTFDKIENEEEIDDLDTKTFDNIQLTKDSNERETDTLDDSTPSAPISTARSNSPPTPTISIPTGHTPDYVINTVS